VGREGGARQGRRPGGAVLRARAGECECDGESDADARHLQSPLMPTFFEALNDLMAAEVPLVTVTIVDTVGSVPQDRGAKAIVTADGLVYGTVGGGKGETKATAEAQRRLRGQIDDNAHVAQRHQQEDGGITY